MVYINRLYKLTSFAQQFGRSKKSSEVSDFIVIVRVQTISKRRRKKVLSKYCVKQVNKNAITKFLQMLKCRRQVIAKYFDSKIKKADCKSTDSILCN